MINHILGIEWKGPKSNIQGKLPLICLAHFCVNSYLQTYNKWPETIHYLVNLLITWRACNGILISSFHSEMPEWATGQDQLGPSLTVIFYKFSNVYFGVIYHFHLLFQNYFIIYPRTSQQQLLSLSVFSRHYALER